MRIFLFIILFIPILISSNVLGSEDTKIKELQLRIYQLETRIEYNESKILKMEDFAGTFGPILFLFAAFCALWAQNTGRNSWLWFIMGFIFHVFTILALLYKNDPET